MKLVGGMGSPTTGACWMSALFYYTEWEEGGSDWWSDHPDCVSPVIRELCICLNDSCCSFAEREELIGPHLFAPMGTRVEDDPRRTAILFRVAKTDGFWFAYYTGVQFAAAHKRHWQKKRKGPEGKRRLLALILELCQIGTPKEVVPRCSQTALFERLEK